MSDDDLIDFYARQFREAEVPRALRPRARQVVLTAIPLATVCAVLAVVLSAGGGASPEREASAPTTSGTLPAGEPLTPQERDAVDTHPPSGYDVDTSAAFAVLSPDLSSLTLTNGELPPSRQRWIVVPGGKDLCFYSGASAAAGACGPRSAYDDHGMSLLTSEHGTPYFNGIAPPQFVEVQVRYGDPHSPEISAEIINGVWELPAAAPRPVEGPLTVTGLDGQTHTIEPRDGSPTLSGPLEVRLVRSDGTSVQGG